MRWLTRVGWLALVFSTLLPAAVRAAEATDVLDAFDGDDPFDAALELNYAGHGKEAKISREDVRDGKTVDVTEFLYVEHKHQVIPRIRIGVFQDIELFLALPYTLVEQRAGWYHPRGGWGRKRPDQQGYSTFERDMCLYGGDLGQKPERPRECEKDWGDTRRTTLSGNPGSWPVNHDYKTDADGRPVPGDYNGKDTDWSIDTDTSDTFAPQFHSVRGAVAYSVNNGYYLFPKGLGDPIMGFAFSPFSFARFNDKRDAAMPAMRIEFSYQLPLVLETPGPNRKKREKLGGDLYDFEPGGTGSGLHRLSAGFAMSKQILLFDPYVGGSYTLGIPHYYPKQAPERAWTDFAFWRHDAVGQAGVELDPLYSLPDIREVVTLRFLLGMTAKYVSKHRGPSEMSDALHKWTYVDHHVALAGQTGLVFAVPFVTLKLRLEAGHESPHLITGETAGTDEDGNGITAKERNPFYNPLLDTPGRRIKVSESNYVDGMLQLAFTL